MLFVVWLTPSPASAQDPLTAALAGLARQTVSTAIQTQGGQGQAWEALPRSVWMRGEMEDLRVNFIPQGQRNSCTAFSTTAALEFQLRRLGLEIDLSEQFLLWAAKKTGADPSDGLTIPELARALARHGLCREELMPYKSAESIIDPSAEALADAKRMPRIAVTILNGSSSGIGMSDADLLLICQTLARRQVVCLAALWNSEGGVFDKENLLQDSPVAGGHMVILTGYQLAKNGEGFFHFRNSWGVKWGDFGHAKMPFSYAAKYGIAALAAQFDFDKKLAGSAEAQAPPSLEPYLVISLILAMILFFVSCQIAAVLFAKRRRFGMGLVGYLLLAGILYLLLTASAGSAAMNWAFGYLQAGAASLGGCIALAAVLFNQTRLWFDLSVGKTFAFLITALALANLLLLVSPGLLQHPAYTFWHTNLGKLPPLLALELLRGEDGDRAALFEAIKSGETKTASNSALPAWVERWRGELESEGRLMRRDNPVAVSHHIARKAALTALLPAEAPSAAPTGNKPPVAAAADQKEALLRLYKEIEQENASLNRADPVAVRKFQQKTEEYRRMRESYLKTQSQQKPTP